MGLQSNGLSLEIVGREISGRPVPGKPRRAAGPYLLGLPALLLSCLLLIPIAFTVVAAFRQPDGSFGLKNFAVMSDPAALDAVGNSLAWIAVALGLLVVGFLLALVSYRLPGLWTFLQPALVIPFAVSVLVSGATFRLIFDPTPERGTVTAVWTRLFGSSPVWLGPGCSGWCWCPPSAGPGSGTSSRCSAPAWTPSPTTSAVRSRPKGSPAGDGSWLSNCHCSGRSRVW